MPSFRSETCLAGIQTDFSAPLRIFLNDDEGRANNPDSQLFAFRLLKEAPPHHEAVVSVARATYRDKDKLQHNSLGLCPNCTLLQVHVSEPWTVRSLSPTR